MYTITVRSRFSSAHNLRGYKGKCEELHGHNWSVELTAAASELDKLGMVMDFTDLKAALNAVVSALDHKYLNNVPPFDAINPTSENIAKFIFEKVKERIKVEIEKVEVWETEGASATYSE